MDKKITFLFGAGTESGSESFGLPSGGEYTLKTMQQKHEKLYAALRKFYKGRLSDSYAKEYRNKFLFEKDSHTFREIIYRAARECIDYNVDDPKYKEYIECVREYEAIKDVKEDSDQIKKEKKDKRGKVKEEAKTVYDLLIVDSDNQDADDDIQLAVGSKNKKDKEFKDYLSFYGAVEKDFSAIVDPNHVGLTQFWRVINYFWSAFFTILEPLCRDFSWYESLNGNLQSFYERVLNDLQNEIKKVYSDYNYDRADSKRGNYYKPIRDRYPDCTAITTNYTPFIEHYWGDNSIYLAGRLSEFEFPEELSVKDIRKASIESSSFVFPFLMTQAPVKPIVVSNQIREYSKALEKLNKTETIVIIGYSLGQADNHINAMLREFALERTKRIIYCYYVGDDPKDANKKREEILRSLKLAEGEVNLDMVANNGNVAELMDKLEKLLNAEEK